MIYTVYVLHSPKFDKIYIGYTSDLEQRMLSHNELGKKGWKSNFGHGKLFIPNCTKPRQMH